MMLYYYLKILLNPMTDRSHKKVNYHQLQRVQKKMKKKQNSLYKNNMGIHQNKKNIQKNSIRKIENGQIQISKEQEELLNLIGIKFTNGILITEEKWDIDLQIMNYKCKNVN